MSDTRGLLDRIAAFRQRLEGTPTLLPESAIASAVPPASANNSPNLVTEAESFRESLREITGSPTPEAPRQGPPHLTSRAHRLLGTAKQLLDRQRAFTADSVFVGLAAKHTEESPNVLVRYHRETVAVTDTIVRLAQSFPDSPSAQLKLCEGLDGLLSVVHDRLAVQERTLTDRRTDYSRIDRLAAVLTALSQGRGINLNPVAALAEELLEAARQTRPLRVMNAAAPSTYSYPGGLEFPAPARYIAAHALTVAQVVARIVPFDYEWASRPLLPVAAALLMDCGMMKVPLHILEKAGPLTHDDRRTIEAHPRVGAEMVLRQVAEAGPVADAIATHHERPDGTGYPAGLKGTTAPSMGRLLAAADLYAALSAARPHRPAADPRAALTESLLAAERSHLDRDFAEYLVNLSFYPVGVVVELTDGSVGVVAANHPNRLNPRAPGRPVVALLTEPDGTLHSRPIHLDLAASEQGGVVRAVPEERRRELLGHRYPDLV